MKGVDSLDKNKKEKILFNRDEIEEKVKELGQIITREYRDKDLFVVSLLRGGFMFTADLVREIDLSLEVDFMTTSSYGNREESMGRVEIVNDIRGDIKDKDVLVVDDIVDSGYTMERIVEHLKKKGPRSIKTCVMLDKPSRRKVDLHPDLVGFTIPDIFIVGYGLNYGDYYRNVPYIFTFE